VLLGIATAPLPAQQRKLAYQGELSSLGAEAVARFTTATQTALFALAGLAAVAVVISYSRGSQPPPVSVHTD
jgi:hypothetical protein